MATALDIGLSYARNAGADLSAKLYYLVKVDTDGDIILCSADGDFALGAVIEAAAENTPVSVQFGGIAKVMAGGLVAAGAPVMAANGGKAITATSAKHVVGIALEGASGDGIVMSVALIPGQVAA